VIAELAVLVVDDEELNREMSRRWLLNAIPCTVDCASTVRYAKELLKKKRYGMVILDMSLPDADDGYEVLQEIRDTSSLNETFVVAFTGYVQSEIDRERFVTYGFDDAWPKMASEAEFKERARQAVARLQRRATKSP